jgi:hypothetical protein
MTAFTRQCVAAVSSVPSRRLFRFLCGRCSCGTPACRPPGQDHVPRRRPDTGLRAFSSAPSRDDCGHNRPRCDQAEGGEGDPRQHIDEIVRPVDRGGDQHRNIDDSGGRGHGRPDQAVEPAQIAASMAASSVVCSRALAGAHFCAVNAYDPARACGVAHCLFAAAGRPMVALRHARACRGHPRLAACDKDVDGRNKSGHDGP